MVISPLFTISGWLILTSVVALSKRLGIERPPPEVSNAQSKGELAERTTGPAGKSPAITKPPVFPRYMPPAVDVRLTVAVPEGPAEVFKRFSASSPIVPALIVIVSEITAGPLVELVTLPAAVRETSADPPSTNELPPKEMSPPLASRVIDLLPEVMEPVPVKLISFADMSGAPSVLKAPLTPKLFMILRA